MSFLLRSARKEDLEQIRTLSRQFTLLNLPDDKAILEKKLAKSEASFAGEKAIDKAEYLFVVEDLDERLVVGTSLILAKHGTPKSPHHYYKVTKKNRFSQDLGIGFIHQVLTFHSDTDGPTEIGGLLVDHIYRRRPEKLGRQISLVRFAYMAMHPERFEEEILCELSPPLGEDGRSEFWEALGRRFTGLPYQEADRISQNNNEFIRSLFPEEDIYVCLLDSKARLAIGRVGEQTRPAQHLLEKLGFQYLNEVDPFDGGPHFGAKRSEIPLVRNSRWVTVQVQDKSNFESEAFLSVEEDGEFRAIHSRIAYEGDGIVVPPTSAKTLGITAGQKIFCSKLEESKS